MIVRKYEFVCIRSTESSDDSINASSSAVKYQMKVYRKNLKDGDVIITNSPRAGGSCVLRNSRLLPNATDTASFASHLPDITIITPIFDEKSGEIIFFTASRGHHADIGGILPGSMVGFAFFPLISPT
jgi:5-oxoprolinase (ATP-hydrolysing)